MGKWFSPGSWLLYTLARGIPLKLTVIGSGPALPQRDRAAPCHLIRHGRETIVVDLGPGSARGLLLNGGITLREVGLILLTHFHPDHCHDLIPFLFALRAEELARHEPLRILGPVGMVDHYEGLRRMWEQRVEPVGYDLRIDDWNREELKWDDLRIKAARTVHSVPNLAWSIEGPEGFGIILTGDGEPTEELIELGATSDHILVTECSLPVGGTVPGHMNPAQAGDLARRCGSRKLILTHFNPDVETVPAKVEAEDHFGGEVIIAEDGMEIEIGEGS